MKKFLVFLPVLAMLFACAQKPSFETAVSEKTKSFTCQEYTSTNSAHKTAGRATVAYYYYYYAAGSGQYLGLSSTTTTLAETSPGYFVKGTCPAVDTEAPSVSVTAPAAGSTVSGSVTFSSASSDNVGVVKVVYGTLVVGMPLCESTVAPFTCTWDSTVLGNGGITVVAVAYDAAGNEGFSAPVDIVIDNGEDTVAPSVELISPLDGSVVFGTINIEANASDNVGVSKVEFYVNGFLHATDTQAPFSAELDTVLYCSDTVHGLSAVAYDAAGNKTTSNEARVQVDNTAPVVSVAAPLNGATVSGTVTLTLNVEDRTKITHFGGVAGFGTVLCEQIDANGMSGSVFSCQWDTTGFANGAFTFQGAALDQAGKWGYSSEVTVTIDNVDIEAPVISITAPAEGSTVSGNVTFSSASSDNVGVTRVVYTTLGVGMTLCETTAAPFTCTWNSSEFTSPTGLSVVAIAYDAAGNEGVSSALNITVDNTFVCQEWTATAGAHSLSGRASYKSGASGWGYYTTGGNDFIGQYLTSATVKITAPNFYKAGSCGN